MILLTKSLNSQSTITPIVMLYNMPAEDLNLTLPLLNLPSLNYNFVVDWGDGNQDTITGATDPNKVHTYATSGNKTVTITGTMEGLMMISGSPNYLIEISGGDNHVFKSLGGTGYGYGALDSSVNLTTFNCPNWDVSQVNDLSYLFWDCGELNYCDVSNWDTSSVTLMIDMWDDATYNLTSIDLSGWNTSSVTSMADMFTIGAGSVLTSIGDVSGWDVSNVEDMSSMFEGQESLLNVSLGTWNTSSLLNTTNMFYNCTAITTEMPASVFWDNLGGGTTITSFTLTFGNATNISNYASIPAGWK